jgi:zinc transport system ATP-binding protein
MKHSLEVYFDDSLIFHSNKKWLYPLFDFEFFLNENNSFRPSKLIVHDKISGRAAALLLVHLKITTVKTELMSTRARQVFEHFNIDFEFETEVEKISCRTEEILQHELNPYEAYRILKIRAGL